MASIKIVLRKNMIRKDNTIPLAIRISENYKTNYKWLGQYVLEKDWDKNAGKAKKTHPNSKKLNNFLLKRLTEANDIYFDSKDTISTKQVKQKLKGAGGFKSFFEVASERIKSKYERGTYSVAKSELSILYNLEEFLNLNSYKDKDAIIKEIKDRRKARISKGQKGEHTFMDSFKYFKRNESLRFQDINESFLEKFKDFCSVYLQQKTRTITNQLIFIRTLFNKAIKTGVVDAKFYPFGGEKEKIRIGSSHKIGLTSKEIEKIEILKLEPNTSIWHTKNVWLIAFYFAGIRISDVVQLRWSDFKDDRLLYIMHKNEKPVSLKIPRKAIKILDQYNKGKMKTMVIFFHFSRC